MRITLVVVLLVIGLGILIEAFTRLVLEPNAVFNMNIGAFRTHHPTRRTQLKPNYQVGDISINSLGLLGPEFTVQRRPRTIRILSIGDSVTFSPPRRNYSRILEELLNRRYPQVDVEVIVGAVPGYSSFEALDWYHETLKNLKPDITIVYLGWNDMGQFHPFGLRYKNEGLYQQPSLLGRAMMHVYSLRIPYFLLGRLERNRPANLSPLTPEEQVILADFRPTHYEQNLTQLVVESKRNRSAVFLVSLTSLLTNELTESDLGLMHYPRNTGRKLAIYHSIYEQYAESLASVARATDTPIIDLNSLVRTPEERKEIFTDTMHITELGAERYASVMVEYVAPVIDCLTAEFPQKGDLNRCQRRPERQEDQRRQAVIF